MESSSFPNRDPRVPFDGAVWVGQVGTQGRLRKLFAVNLSRGGMFLRTEEPLPVGQPLMVALDSSQEIVPIANAEVVWQRPARAGDKDDSAGVGIAFRELQPDAAALLEQLLEHAPARHRSVVSAEPVTPALTPEELAAEPYTNIHAEPPARETEAPVPETRAFWTGFSLPNRSRVKARVLARELMLDFGTEGVERVSHEGNQVTIRFRKAVRPV